MLRSTCVPVDQKAASFPGGVARLRLTHVWDKLMNQVMRLKAEKQLTSNDVVVAIYLMDTMDNETGIAARKLATIAARTGICKDEVIKSIKRLVEHGVVEKEVRRNGADTKQASNHYHWPGFRSADQAGPGDTLSPGTPDQVGNPRVGDHRPSYIELPDNPYGSSIPALQRKHESEHEAPSTDWPGWHHWMAGQRPWGKEFGQEILAEGFIDRWRGQIGDRLLLRALAQARDKGLWGPVLLDWLEHRVDYHVDQHHGGHAA